MYMGRLSSHGQSMIMNRKFLYSKKEIAPALSGEGGRREKTLIVTNAKFERVEKK
jgi:hypothetical protein